MSTYNIGSLVVEMSANVARLQKDMADAKGVVDRGAANISKAAGLAKTALGAIGAGLTTAGLAAWLKQSIDLADRFQEMAERTGIATEALSAWTHHAKFNGLAQEDLEKGFTKLIGQAANGSKAFAAMGISTRDLANNLKAPDALMAEVADRFAGIESASGKTALALDMFGEKLGGKLIPMLSQGADGFDAARAEAERLGIIMAGSTAQAAGVLNDHLDRLAATGTGLANQILQQTLPALNMIGEAFVEGQRTGTGFGNFLGGTLKNTLQTMMILGSDVAFVFRGIGRDIGGMAAQLAALARGDFKGFSVIGQALKDDAARARKELDAWQAGVFNRGLGDKLGLGDVGSRQGKASGDEWLKGYLNSVDKGKRAIAAKQAELQSFTEAQFAALTAMHDYERMNQVLAEQEPLRAAAAASWDEQARRADAYAESLNAVEIAAADLQIQANDLAAAYQDSLTAAAVESANALTAEVDALRLYNEEIGLTDTELQRLAQTRLDVAIAAKEQAYADADLTEANADQLAAIAEQIRLLKEKRGLLIDGQSRQTLADEARALSGVWQSIEATAHDTFVSIFDAGKSTFDRLRDTLKNGLLDLLYQMTLKKWIINLSTSVSGAAVSNGAFASSGSSGVAGNLLSSFGSSMLGGVGASAAAGMFSAFGGAGAAQASMLAAQTAGFGMAGTASTLSALGSGMGGAMSALGSAIPIIGGIALLASLFGNKKPSGKYAWGSLDMASGDAFDVGSMTGDKYSKENNDAVAGMLQTAQGYRSLLQSMGGSVTGSYRFSASDREGYGLALNGGDVQYTRDRDEYMDKVLDSMVGAASGLSDELRNLITTFEGTAEETATYVSTLAAVRNQLAPSLEAIGLSIGTMANGIHLVEQAGGIDALMGNLTGYYQAFYSEQERAEQATKDMTAALAEVNLALPTSKDGFRALVDGLDLTSAAGREAFAVLMQLAPTFVQVADLQAQAAEQARAALLGEADVSGARSSIASALSSLSQSVDSVGGSMDSVAASVSELASAGAGIRDWIRAARAGDVMALTSAQQYDAARRQYRADLALAQGGDVDASGRITQSADAYLGALRDNSASRDVYQTAAARIINELAALPATQTWEQQVIQGLSNVTASVESLKTGSLKLEMVVTAQSEIEKVIKLIGDTTSLPRDVKELALATSGTIYRTIAAIVDSSWTDETYRLGFGATTDLTRTLAAIVGSTWTPTAQNLAFGTAHDLSRTLNAIVGSSWSEVTQRLAFGTSTDISRTLNTIVGSSWDAQTTQMAFGLTTDLNRALNAVVGAGWDEETKMLAFGTIQDAVRRINTILTTNTGDSLQSALAVLFAQDSTVRRTIEIILAGDAAGGLQQISDALRIQSYAGGLESGLIKFGEPTMFSNGWQEPTFGITPQGTFQIGLPIPIPYQGTMWQVLSYPLVPAYAEGGAYAGGLALVGEQGPELINFSQPGQVYTAGQTASMLNNDEMVAELRALRREVTDLRHEARATANHTSKTARLIERAMPDGDALATRTAEAL